MTSGITTTSITVTGDTADELRAKWRAKAEGLFGTDDVWYEGGDIIPLRDDSIESYWATLALFSGIPNAVPLRGDARFHANIKSFAGPVVPKTGGGGPYRDVPDGLVLRLAGLKIDTLDELEEAVRKEALPLFERYEIRGVHIAPDKGRAAGRKLYHVLSATAVGLTPVPAAL